MTHAPDHAIGADTRTESGTSTGWFFTLCLSIAAVAVGYAIHLRDGEYHPAAIHLIGAAILLCAAGVCLPSVRRARWSDGAVLVTLVGALLFQFHQLLACSPGGAHWWSNDLQNTSRGNFLFFNVTVCLAWLLILICIWKAERWGRYVFQLVLVAHVALGVWMIRSSPAPRIDVFVFQQEGAGALLRGENPYTTTYPDIYRETGQTDRLVYGMGMSRGGKLGFGFPYPPLSLILSTAGFTVAGDHRYAQLLAMTVAGWLIAYTRPGSRVAMLAAAGLLFTPRGLFVLGRGWTEPFVVLGLAAVAFASSRAGGEPSPSLGTRPVGRVLLPIALGLFLATKQYLVLAIPAAAILLPRGSRLLTYVALLATAVAVAIVVTLPLALWHPTAFVDSTWTVQRVAPFREDALSYLVWWLQQTGQQPGTAVAFVAALLAVALALWRAPRGPAGFAAALALVYLPFIALNKQAFANYYYFTTGALWCAVAAMPVESRRDP